MMGQLDAVKAFVAARPGIQKTLGPHGITLMSHAKAGGPDALPVVQYLAALGDADTPLPTQPLTAADRDALVGKYVYGPGPRDFFTIDVQQDRLGIDRPNSPSRRFLLHTGNLVFFPNRRADREDRPRAGERHNYPADRCGSGPDGHRPARLSPSRGRAIGGHGDGEMT